MYVKPKKALGQHFLKEPQIAQRIVEALIINSEENNLPKEVLEIGPGTGVLTTHLIERSVANLKLIEIDSESVEYLHKTYPQLKENLIEGDFLKMELSDIFESKFSVIGNFPYNISSQIFFKILEHRESIPLIVCMLQKEVAERLASKPGGKEYGILSVLLQAWYNIEYLFTVEPGAFIPPPKVKSAVIRLTENGRVELGCDKQLFKKIVKGTFNQRRKRIKNSIKSVIYTLDNTGDSYMRLVERDHLLLTKRPEQLSVEEFVELTNLVSMVLN